MPEPVGAQISVCSPPAMTGQPCAWASVGAAKDAPNQSRVAGLKAARGSVNDVSIGPADERRRGTGAEYMATTRHWSLPHRYLVWVLPESATA